MPKLLKIVNENMEFGCHLETFGAVNEPKRMSMWTKNFGEILR